MEKSLQLISHDVPLILNILKLQLVFLSSIVFACFQRLFPKGEYVNLAFSIIWLPLEGIAYSTVRYSYLSTFLDDNADIFATSLLISYCSFSFLILSSIIIISFYILSTRFCLKPKRLSNARVESLTKKEYGYTVHFL